MQRVTANLKQTCQTLITWLYFGKIWWGLDRK